MTNKRSERTLRIVYAAMFAAMITVMTALIKIPSPTAGGYVHLGDTIVYLTSCILPLPYALVACGIGGGLADLLAGYPDVIIFTVIIKALNTLFFNSKEPKIFSKRNALMTIPSGFVTIIGYSISKFIRDLLLGTTIQVAFTDALLKMPENAVQAFASAIAFILLAIALDKANLKQNMLRSKIWK